jgi:hypothetical protein
MWWAELVEMRRRVRCDNTVRYPMRKQKLKTMEQLTEYTMRYNLFTVSVKHLGHGFLG